VSLSDVDSAGYPWRRYAVKVEAGRALRWRSFDQAASALLYARSEAERWQVSAERLHVAIERSLDHRFPGAVTDLEAAVYLESLHLDDLALACACIDGHDGAWEHFVRELRPQLYHAARTIAGDDCRELADSLYGELFGLPGKDGVRRSLLAHYHGRSRLITWLRSVLVQRHIDRLRVTRRLEPLDDEESGGSMHAQASTADPDPERDTLVGHAQRALDAAIDALESRDRLRLRLYYGQDMTLAAIGRVLGEHEATVSRKLDKARRALKAQVERALAGQGLAPAAVARAFELAADAPDLQLDRLLTRAEDG
jgi:RNA polymerase sigma-70 factor (ECF subfamily)